MQTIATVYKIGRGPSSSHTIGPSRACKDFKQHYPQANNFIVVTLYGSLALTGRGHRTDLSIEEALKPDKVKIVWDTTTQNLPHPNTMDIEGFDNDKILHKKRYISIGGGNIIDTETNELVGGNEVYQEKYATQILDTCKKEKLTLLDFVKKHEPASTWSHLKDVWTAMQKAAETGLSMTGEMPTKLHWQRQSKFVYDLSEQELQKLNITPMTKYLTAYALAISETNACGGVVVTAATLGSAGILPAVLLMCKKLLKTSNEEIINALAVAALIADIARTNGSIAGAEVGCQGECGVACSMAAAAYGYLIGLNNEEIFEAAAIGLKHHLGLTCDPVLGEIYSPCIERNVMGAIRGVDAANNVYMTRNKHNWLFTFDDVIECMMEVGKSIIPELRETSIGGLANVYRKKSKDHNGKN